jgi:hypothetical protein
VPVEDPRILQDLEVNDLTRLPWFFKRLLAPIAGWLAHHAPRFVAPVPKVAPVSVRADLLAMRP